jgi:hypothetical protein
LLDHTYKISAKQLKLWDSFGDPTLIPKLAFVRK